MKPFVLEEALAGAKVINGSQDPATDIAYFPSEGSTYKVGAVINGGVLFFTVTGNYRNGLRDPERDLFMAPVKKEGWINIYENEETGRTIWKTETAARAHAYPNLINCIHIEW
jgi:hypothetical protein